MVPSVALNEVTRCVALNAVRGDARDVVIQSVVILSAATRCVVTRFAVARCVVDLAAMVDSQYAVLPNDARDVSSVDLLSLDAVQSEVAQDAALFVAVPAPV